jgi:hypothetical protein
MRGILVPAFLAVTLAAQSPSPGGRQGTAPQRPLSAPAGTVPASAPAAPSSDAPPSEAVPPPREAAPLEELALARRAASLGASMLEQAGTGPRRRLELASMHFRAALAYQALDPGNPLFTRARQGLDNAEARLASLNAPAVLHLPREMPPPPPRPALLGVGPDGVPFEAVGP